MTDQVNLTKMTIEIIMPVYNTGVIINRGVESIMRQTVSDWRLWIVNDGSTDSETLKTLEWCRSRDQNRIKVIDKVNGGVSSARNEALRLIAPDSLIAYCDSDDWWEPNHLEISLGVIGSGYDMTYCNPTVVNENLKETKMNFKLYNDFNAKRFVFGNFIFISGVVHRNGLGEFDSSLDSLEDFDMWVRATKAGYKIKQHQTTMTYLARKGTLASQGRNKLPALKQKHGDFFVTRLHLGCGNQYLPNFVNCDLFSTHADVGLDCATMRLHDYPFESDFVDEIMAYHLIEHFDFMQGQDVIREWHRLLKPGGRLHIETPDMLGTCAEFVKANEQRRIQLYGHFWAWPWLPGQAHRFLYTETQLFWLLSQTGFKNIKRLSPDSIYAPGQDPALFLNVEAFK